jgi:hypothetical protein
MDELLSLDTAREAFSQTEPLASVVFWTGVDVDRTEPPVVSFGEKWFLHLNEIEPAEAWLVVPELNAVYQLTFEAARQLGSLCHINQAYQQMVPPTLHEDAVRWWLKEGLGARQLKLLLSPHPGADMDGAPCPLAVALTRATVTPFSNLSLLDAGLSVVRALYSPEAADSAKVHFSLSHDLEHTDFRIFVPDAAVVVKSGTDVHEWLPGFEVSNSAIGLKQTTVTGALMRMDTAGVALDMASSAGGFKRRDSTPQQAYEWAAEAVKDVLGALDEGFCNVRELVGRPVGIEPGVFVASMCNDFRIAKAQMERVTAMLENVDDGELTMYELANVVSRAANMDELGWRQKAQLMAMAGHIVHAVGGRCTDKHPCFRSYPPGFEPPA